MSKAFVQGKDRPSMPKPDVPEGYVKMKYHGNIGDNGREFKRPIPYVTDKTGSRRLPPLVVGKDRMCLVTEAEATYLEQLHGPFTRVESPQPEVMVDE